MKIRDIKAGNHKVLARDEHTGKMAYQAVLDTYWNPYKETVYITIRDIQTGDQQTIVSNCIHPFYVSNVVVDLKLVANGSAALKGTNATGEWIEAHDLKAGQRLLNQDESWSEVVSVKIEQKPLEAYNLHVDQFHSFFVRGAANDNTKPVWVHNACGGVKPSLSSHKAALKQVHQEVGNLPKGKPGKFGSPQAGDARKGYRLDPPHTGAAKGTAETAESKFHFNWWDYTRGRRGKGGRSGAIPIGD